MAIFFGWIACGAYLMVAHRRLMKYLVNNHHHRCYLFSGLRWLPYIFNDLDDEDPQIVTLKAAYKRALLYIGCVVGVALLMFFAVAMIITFFQK